MILFCQCNDNGYPAGGKKCVSICNRNFGIGADGIIFVLPSEKATLQMRIFNSDGSEAEMCGNGIRAFAKWAHELGLVSKHHFSVETGAGILFPELLPDGKVRVDMGVPHLNSSEIPVTGFGDGMVVNRKLTNDLHTYRITCVSMGNPHCVIFTDDIDRISLEEIGSRLEADAHFPRKTNVEFAQLLKKIYCACVYGNVVLVLRWLVVQEPARLLLLQS